MRAMDIMTPNVITVGPETLIHALARLLLHHGISGVPVIDQQQQLVGVVSEGDLLHRAEAKRIKRVPVVQDGKILGIVSRANLVRALAAMESESSTNADAGDREIRQKLIAELNRQEWFTAQDWCKVWAPDVIVKDGVVHFWLCDDQSQQERLALRVAAENLAGVRRVEEHTIPGPGDLSC